MCSSWSAMICFVSYSRRPISVDLPSSTEPQVTSRSSSVAASCSTLEVADTLPVLHRGLRRAIVRARLAALADPGGGDLRPDLLERRRARLDRAGAAHVADRAEAHRGRERLLVRQPLDHVAGGVEHPVAPEHLAL